MRRLRMAVGPRGPIVSGRIAGLPVPPSPTCSRSGFAWAASSEEHSTRAPLWKALALKGTGLATCAVGNTDSQNDRRSDTHPNRPSQCVATLILLT
jgi:hypothetical protein